ncbi:MAG: VanZ family protein [Atopobiaceae bacterium]|jgi:VanZ family protein|nr:VanZ family protein [Atopobiaceae bacterium]MCI2172861.1 VanZ family protein [Atopobiaceae bacterium]MCI2207168.1 VanZ family protein [Atopobiaceae bacterium]
MSEGERTTSDLLSSEEPPRFESIPTHRVSPVRAIAFVALLAWVAFIWGHSLVPGEASNTESYGWVAMLSSTFTSWGVGDARTMNLIVRKTAHFLEYAALGILLVMAWRPRWRHPSATAVAAVLMGVAVPCVDETIQRFVPNRSGQLTDVLLDVCGMVFGLLVATGVRALVRRVRSS